MREAISFSLLVVAMLGCRTSSSQKASHAGLLAEIRAPQIMEFGGEIYPVKYSAIGNTWAVVEYYRSGENRKSWGKMLRLRLDSDGLDSLQQAERMERLINAQTYGSSTGAYKSPSGHSIESGTITSVPHRHEQGISRYWDRTNGTVSLQFSQLLASSEVHRLERKGGTELYDFYEKIRGNMANAMKAMDMPDIEAHPLPRQ
jgi:hypothetical protein